MRVAVVGATGAVGRTMTAILEERAFPLDDLALFASPRSEGVRIDFRGEAVTVRALHDRWFDGVDLALFSAGREVSRRVVPEAAEAGTVCVDNSSAFRMKPTVPLVVPELNGHALDRHHGVIANPNCTTITAVMAVGPLHREARLEQLVVSSYQSVSGSGMRGIRELADQVEKLHGFEEQLVAPDRPSLPAGELYGKTIAFNVLALQGEPGQDAWTSEERKFRDETRKILAAPELEVQATVVRVPVVTGHATSVYARFARPIAPGEARRVLGVAPGVRVMDDPAAGEYPTPLDAAGTDDVLVGRVRQASDRDDALLLFACGDNLRKGAALNAVQIAELLVLQLS
jgi:aspartate-semialdehyde dehydrogenase